MIFSPLNYLFLLLLLTYIFRKKPIKRLFAGIAILIFIVFGTPALLNGYARWFQPEPVILGAEDHFSCGILLGGFGSVDSDGNGYFNSASDRFLETVRLYQTGKIGHILISGGNSKKNDEDFTEAKWAKEQMIQFGVPEEKIFIDDKANNTRGNARYAAEILNSNRFQPPYLLISSAYHIPRAKKQFERNGVEVIAYPANYSEGRGKITFKDFIPSLRTLQGWGTYVKETVGLLIGR